MASVEVVLPVYNEERALAPSVVKLHAYMGANVFHDWRITIADNGSHDGTLEIAERLAHELPRVEVFHVPEAGRGRALTPARVCSDAGISVYIGIDLSTRPEALPPPVDAIAAGRAGNSARPPLGGRGATQP